MASSLYAGTISEIGGVAGERTMTSRSRAVQRRRCRRSSKKAIDDEQQIQRVERHEVEEEQSLRTRRRPADSMRDGTRSGSHFQERELPEHLARQVGALAGATPPVSRARPRPDGPRRRSPVAQCAATSHSSSRCEARYGTAACLPLRPSARAAMPRTSGSASSSPRSA